MTAELIEAELNSSVQPSGSARTTAATPTIPPPPGRFSTTNA